MERQFDGYKHKQEIKRLLSNSEEIARAVQGLGGLLDKLERHREDGVVCKDPILDDDPGVISDIGLGLKHLSLSQLGIFEDMMWVLNEFDGKKIEI